MSSPIGPLGSPATTDVQQTTTAPDAGAAPVTGPTTITEGLKVQQDCVDKAMQNVRTGQFTAVRPGDSTCATDTATLLSATDLAGLQFKSAAQRQLEPSTTGGGTTGPLVKDIAMNKAKVLSPASTVLDAVPATDVPATGTAPANDAATVSATTDVGAAPPADNVTAPPANAATGGAAPTADASTTAATGDTPTTADLMADASTDITLPDPTQILRMLQDTSFQQIFGMVFGMASFLGNLEWSGYGSRQASLAWQTQPGQAQQDPHPVRMRKWMQMMMVGGQLTEVVFEQFKTTVGKVVSTKIKETVHHVFTPQEVARYVKEMQQNGIMPTPVPDQEKVCANIAKAAQDTLDRLNRQAAAARL